MMLAHSKITIRSPTHPIKLINCDQVLPVPEFNDFGQTPPFLIACARGEEKQLLAAQVLDPNRCEIDVVSKKPGVCVCLKVLVWALQNRNDMSSCLHKRNTCF
jgi:hypothetical protein